MLKKLVLATFFFFPLIVFAQIPFEKGYFIDHNRNKVECLVKDMDWRNSPNKIVFKLTLESEPKTIDISAITEFGIYGSSKYVMKNVKIDNSNDNLNNLTYDRSPSWSEEQLLLKVLVEGKASLFYYQNPNVVRFFYSVNGSDILQLIYKKYLVESNSLAINSDFRQQLWTNVNCGGLPQKAIRNISYYSESLIRHFNTYNACSVGNKVDSTKVSGFFNVKIKTGVDVASFQMATNSNAQYYAFDTNTSLRIGVESEYTFPFSKNKLSILVEPTFQHYYDASGPAMIRYNSIETPLGMRYYFYSHQKTRLFMNGFFIWDIPFHSEVSSGTYHFSTVSSVTVAFGGGLSSGKFTFEFRGHSTRFITSPGSTNYDKTSFIVGYTLFSKGNKPLASKK